MLLELKNRLSQIFINNSCSRRCAKPAYIKTITFPAHYQRSTAPSYFGIYSFCTQEQRSKPYQPLTSPFNERTKINGVVTTIRTLDPEIFLIFLRRVSRKTSRTRVADQCYFPFLLCLLFKQITVQRVKHFLQLSRKRSRFLCSMCVTELNRLQTPRLPKPGPCPSLSISHTLRNNPINHFPLLCATISLEKPRSSCQD